MTKKEQRRQEDQLRYWLRTLKERSSRTAKSSATLFRSPSANQRPVQHPLFIHMSASRGLTYPQVLTPIC